MTIMFCAYEGEANILRLYCKARAVQEKDKEWDEYIAHFDCDNLKKASRQVFEVFIEGVNNSCGMGVPLYEFTGQREDLVDFYNKGSKEDHIEYMKKKNQVSFDGKPTKLFDD